LKNINKPIKGKNFLTIVQISLWYLMAGWFIVVVALMNFGSSISLGTKLAAIGLIIVLISAPLRIFVMAEQFRRVGKTRYAWFSYLLLLMLVATAILRYNF